MEPWQRPSGAYLVQLGLDALMADIEAPSLPLLAGLARGEYPQARELFDLVLGELGLLPLTSEDLAKARWTAAQWWAGQIVGCQLDPVHGAKLIYEEAAAELDYPDALQPIVDLARALDLPNDQPPDQQHIRDRVTSAARDFLATEARQNHAFELRRMTRRDRFTESEPEPVLANKATYLATAREPVGWRTGVRVRGAPRP